MAQNQIVIFSNGIADFRRTFAVLPGEPTRIAIPVRTDHIADVLASLNIYGNVTVAEPPSYRPARESESRLSIDPGQALEDLAKKLHGAKVAVERPGGTLLGVLVGLHTEPEGKLDERVFPKSLVVLTAEGFAKIPLKDVSRWRFEEQTVRAEIDKDLERSRQAIRPQSTLIELALTADGQPGEALVQYTVPSAAWKISYRLRVADEAIEFQGFAIVDNNTEEDWKDCLISVVTGEPITFSTDLAVSKIPRRGHVDVVRGEALGAVEIEEASYAPTVAGGPGVVVGMPAPESLASAKLGMLKRSRSAGMATMVHPSPPTATSQAEVREIGDFCVFESQSPVSIDAGRSAAIPVFNAALTTAATILHYKFENHPERPFRAIEFNNETGYSLGRGVCTVYEDATYAGSCIIPPTRPGGECLLPHALETGVKVRQEVKRIRAKIVGLRLSEGFAYTSVLRTQETVYRVKNLKRDLFKLLVDHDHRLPEPQIECTVSVEPGGREPHEIAKRLKNGIRLSIPLEAEEELLLSVVETRVEETSVRLADWKPKQDDLNVGWLTENLVATNGPLAGDPAVQRCLEIQQAIDRKRQEISDAVAETERLAVREDRLRKNIGTGGQDEQTGRWRVELAEAESRIRTLDESEIPKLREEERAIKEELRTALLGLSAEWKAE